MAVKMLLYAFKIGTSDYRKSNFSLAVPFQIAGNLFSFFLTDLDYFVCLLLYLRKATTVFTAERFWEYFSKTEALPQVKKQTNKK